MKKLRVRTGQPSVTLSRKEFEARFMSRYFDPAFEERKDELRAILDVAWEAYHEYRKSPRTRKAGKGFADPGFDLHGEHPQVLPRHARELELAIDLGECRAGGVGGRRHRAGRGGQAGHHHHVAELAGVCGGSGGMHGVSLW